MINLITLCFHTLNEYCEDIGFCIDVSYFNFDVEIDRLKIIDKDEKYFIDIDYNQFNYFNLYFEDVDNKYIKYDNIFNGLNDFDIEYRVIDELT